MAKKTPEESTIEKIKKRFGETSIIKLGEEVTCSNVNIIPTGILSLDLATGIGGIPRGRIVEFFGPESAGKTMLSLCVVREALKMGINVAFIDAEHALNVELAKGMDIDIDSVYISQPDSGEEALEIVNMLCDGGDIGLVVVDSVAALVPRAEIDGDMGDAHVGLQARLMSQAMRKITAPAKRNDTCVIFINQLRMKVNAGGYGNPETTTGGRALPFYASMRVDVRSVGQIKNNDNSVIGRRTRLRIVKNKLAAPFREAMLDLLFTEKNVGFDVVGDLIELGVKTGLIEKNGSWYSMEGKRIGQGLHNAKEYIVTNGLVDRLRKDIVLCVEGE